MNAVITGATKGIGRAIAERMARRGINLCICARHPGELEETRKDLLNINSQLKIFIKKADLSNKAEVAEFGNYSLDVFSGKIDILVNNAGVFIPGRVTEEEDGILEKTIHTNLFSVYHLTRSLLPAMQARPVAYIINMGSVAGLKAYPNGGSYCISKFALRGFSMVLREELKDSDIKVTTIMPGATWSNSWKGTDLPEERLMQASDVAIAIDSILDMSPAAVMEEVIMRPQKGDL